MIANLFAIDPVTCAWCGVPAMTSYQGTRCCDRCAKATPLDRVVHALLRWERAPRA